MTHPTTIQLGYTTTHRLVEQETREGDRHACDFLPNLRPELLDANRHRMLPRSLDEQDRIILCIQSHIMRTPSGDPSCGFSVIPSFLNFGAAADVKAAACALGGDRLRHVHTWRASASSVC
jgi:hypothetical protein